MDMLERLSLAGLVPVIKVEDAADAVPLCEALLRGGLPVAEITFRSAAAEEAIRNVHEHLPEVMLGAGTVLTTEQADRALAAGAAYIVSPGLNPTVVKHCIEKGAPIVPGCSGPSDIEAALELGVTTVKFFPAEALGGLATIKAMSAPYGNVRFLPTGGVNERNLNDYLAFPKIVACGGSWMVPSDAIAQKDWARVEELTRGAVNTMLGLCVAHVGVNAPDETAAHRDAERLCTLMGLSLNRDGQKSVFAGNDFEVMKGAGLGAHGHIAIGCRSVARARWHLERRGFTFDEEHKSVKNGKVVAVYLQEEIAGFAFHLLQL